MKFAFLADLTEFVGRLNDNLTYYYGSRWKGVLNPDMEINPFRATVSVDKTTIWDVLTQLYELYSVRWSIEEDNGQISIKIGFPAPEIEHLRLRRRADGRSERRRNRTGFDPARERPDGHIHPG